MPAVGRIADREGAAPVVVGHEVLFAGEIRPDVVAIVAKRPAVPALGGERLVLEGNRGLAGKRTRRAAKEVLGGYLIAIGFLQGTELHADLRRHELLDADVALAEQGAVLAGQAQLDRPGTAWLLGRHRKRGACHRPGGVGTDRNGAERLAAGTDQHQRKLVDPAVRRRPRSARLPHQRLNKYRFVVAVDAALRPDKRLARAVREVVVAPAAGTYLACLHARDKGHEGAVPALDGENAIGLGDNRGFEATEPVRACRGGGKEPVVARIGLDADAFDRDSVGERGHPDREVMAVLAHMEAEVCHADDAAAAPAGVDIGGVDAWRRVDDIGRETDVRRGY